MDQVKSHCACTPFGEITNTTNEGDLHYYRFSHHCRPHHCRTTGGDDLLPPVLGSDNQKMVGCVTEPAVMTTITANLCYQLAVAGRPAITAGSSQEPTVSRFYHCLF
jgi:hypothetical protein